jgi:hypothetical protein
MLGVNESWFPVRRCYMEVQLLFMEYLEGTAPVNGILGWYSFCSWDT